jgi:hypothetical protein
MNKITLLIPQKIDAEFEQIFASWIQRGGEILRLDKYWLKSNELINKQLAIYGNQTFALILAQIYEVELISPDDSLIARLDSKWTKRQIAHIKIEQLKESTFPIFIKLIIPKSFESKVYTSFEDFKSVADGLEQSEEILTSEIIKPIEAEARAYILEGKIMDMALYEGFAEIEIGRVFLQDFIENNKQLLPTTLVIDLAFNHTIGWFILEFNACWGAGLNNCKADKVIDCILAATINKSYSYKG